MLPGIAGAGRTRSRRDGRVHFPPSDQPTTSVPVEGSPGPWLVLMPGSCKSPEACRCQQTYERHTRPVA
eukprot:scaffold199955_cov21-Tisochrysis_lutea.AAC.1